jgi:hypothetical protein
MIAPTMPEPGTAIVNRDTVGAAHRGVADECARRDTRGVDDDVGPQVEQRPKPVDAPFDDDGPRRNQAGAGLPDGLLGERQQGRSAVPSGPESASTATGLVFGRRSRWVFATQGNSPAVTRLPPDTI